MLRLNFHSRKIDTVFLVLLFSLFAVTAFTLVLVGAKQYQLTADAMNGNYELRTTTSYLREKIRQYDTDAGVMVEEFAGSSALTLENRIDDKTYRTYIYYYDGALRELVVGENAVYTPETGQEIITLSGFAPELVHSGLIRVVLTDTEGIRHELCLDTKANARREVP
ncbi:MAG: DUF4860 domain-containing protein [Muribaculaceae bacterium]|nr:DUF4860 domain-containing protein [Roseburia sp.]MCM1430243.1 DUF4860 domain-containing protein [Muribaculaceae bacterium]MCM1493675.1 DUF4860 domain-containing protein [Muribaculaceae bacterium]